MSDFVKLNVAQDSADVEERWIESEHALLLHRDEQFDHDIVDLGNLFADPEPYDTFTFKFELITDNDSSEECSLNSSSLQKSTISIVLDGIKAENGQKLHSTGLTIWKASTIMCDFLRKQPNIVQGKKVLELGAGLGLCGIFASHLRPAQVMMTDGDTDTLEQMRRNVSSNAESLESDAVHVSSLLVKRDVQCKQLRWGHDTSTFLHNYGNFDVIMGSDIIYLEEVLEPLFDTVSQLLSINYCEANCVKEDQDYPKFILAFARRNVNIHLVLDCAQRFGFQVSSNLVDIDGVYIFQRLKKV